MQELKEFIRQSGSNCPWISHLLRLVTIAALVVALGLAGSAFAEYRLLHAVASLPHAEGATVLTLDCPASLSMESERSEVVAPDSTVAPQVPSMLQGLRCTIPLYPD